MDSREDLPQVIAGMAVTRDGIPVRVWSWPGNTADSGLIAQVRTDRREWVLPKVIWVAGRGFTSAENRRFLMRDGGGGYISRGEAPFRLCRGEGRPVPAGPVPGRPG